VVPLDPTHFSISPGEWSRETYSVAQALPQPPVAYSMVASDGKLGKGLGTRLAHDW